jgi:PPOX class probable F420-dependent enzyme
MADLDLIRSLVADEQGLAVVATTRADGSVQASVVNSGVLPHPVDGSDVVAFVAAGTSVRLKHLRARPRTTLVFRHGWNWAAVEGRVELAGPDDPLAGVDAERLRVLMREIFTAAGGTHEDFDEFDRAMADERRVAVLVRPDRISSNPGA